MKRSLTTGKIDENEKPRVFWETTCCAAKQRGKSGKLFRERRFARERRGGGAAK